MQGIEGWARTTRIRGEVPRRLLSIIGILIFGAILYCGGIEALRQVVQANPLYLGCAFVAGGLAAFLTSVRWGLIVNSLEGRVVHSRLRYFYYVLMGKMSSLLVSQYVGDYGVRPLALKASGSTTLGKAFYSVLLDRLFDLILSLLFLIPTLLYLVGSISSEVMMLSFLVLLGAYWVVSSKNHWILTDSLAAVTRWVDRQKTKVPLTERALARVVEIMEGASRGFEAIGQSCITPANFLTFGRYVAMVFRAYFISLALHLTIPFSVLFVSVGIVRFSLLFAVAPGRLGVLEVGWYGVLALAGIESSQIIPLLIALRVYGFLFNAMLALSTHIVVVALPGKRG